MAKTQIIFVTLQPILYIKQMILKQKLIELYITNSQTASAQRQKTHKKEVSTVVEAYIDSLAKSKLRIDTLATVGRRTSEEQLYRLFIPLTFYHSTARKALAIDDSQWKNDEVYEAVIVTMRHVYLNRPDLVSVT